MLPLIILGAQGMFAHDLILAAQARHWPYTAFSKAEADLTKPEALAQCLKALPAGPVLNCAAYTQVDRAESEAQQAEAINHWGVQHLANICLQQQRLLVHISTDFVFDGQSKTPYLESALTAPLSVYGRTKREGELAILNQGTEALIVRTSWLYGVKGHNFVKTMLRLAREKPALRVVNDQIGSPTWSADLAQALLRLLECGARGIVHYSNREFTSWYGFAVEILQQAQRLGLLQQSPPITPIPTSDYPTPASRPAYSVLDCRRYQELTGSVPPPWASSLGLMLQQLQLQENS